MNHKKLREYEIPDYIKQRFWKDHAQNLTKKEVDKVFDSFKDFVFLASFKPVYLSSYIIDEAWHTFILFTKDYHQFCNAVVGKYFHHHPSIKRGGFKADLSEMEDTYWLMKEKLPKSKLFTLDKEYGIKGSSTKGVISLKSGKRKVRVFLNDKKIGSFSQR